MSAVTAALPAKLLALLRRLAEGAPRPAPRCDTLRVEELSPHLAADLGLGAAGTGRRAPHADRPAGRGSC
ncbi:MAG: hypothetical protein JF625_01030 [Inquilinus limosus]|uniref:Uncharacterized protein n=1 Tax=Inquilinus limosus TaxID=171674 RepID=A0A952KFD2_9PROT|nr:hypothetical protein [Inquilinus limosus]